MNCNVTSQHHKISQGQVLLSCFQKYYANADSGYGEKSASPDEYTCNDTEDVERRGINNIIETDNDTKEELEQRLEEEDRDAACYHEITRQTFLSNGTLLLSCLVMAAYFLSNFWGRREPKQFLPIIPHC